MAVLKRMICSDENALKRAELEIQTHEYLSTLQHENIVGFYDYKINASKRGGYEVFILMEYCQEQLIDILKSIQNLQESEILHIFSHVCNAVSVLHSQSPLIIQ